MKLCDELEARQKKKQETRILINNAALNKLLTADTPETFTKNWQRIGDNFDILYSAPENIGKLRQAILQLAVMGKLVPQNANDEPAAVLLERIKKEKERLVKEGKVKKEKSLPAIKDDEIPFDLPIGWEWVRLGELAKVIEYGTSEKSSELRDDVPVFRMNNVQEGKIIFENLKYVSATIKDLPRLYLQHGDLLFNRTNSYELVGKTGVFKGISNQYTFASYLIKISLMLEYISPDFINTAINSAYFRQTQINPEITQQCGQANFNGTKLKNTLIPLPPLAEQKRIVTKVDKLMKLCDELETKLTQTQTEREKIINAAVKQLLTV
ncbi:MAG: restriction endonuclease subunit S [Aphanizomenon flos-aquae Clear-A1]|nr:restriction endonuclease subunit S [Aphanizomenon flos-aquae Clear-A1]